MIIPIEIHTAAGFGDFLDVHEVSWQVEALGIWKRICMSTDSPSTADLVGEGFDSERVIFCSLRNGGRQRGCQKGQDSEIELHFGWFVVTKVLLRREKIPGIVNVE